MPLISQSGSIIPTSNPTNPPSDPGYIPAPVVPGLVAPVPPTPYTNDAIPETPSTYTDILENLPIVKDPALDRMAFDQNQYPNSTAAIQGFMEGHRIQVIFFESLNTKVSTRSNIVDTPTNRHNIHAAYRRIDQLEITLKEPWSYNYDPSNTQSSVGGTAIFYPGLQPKIGDIFLATVGDNKIGMFKITQATPGSWRNSRSFEVAFYFFAYLTEEDIAFLQSATVDARVFDKVNFLGNTTSLLSENRYLDLKTMRQMRDNLSIYYVRHFFNSTVGSYFRPDTGVYDPYLVKFISSMTEVSVVKMRPIQLFAGVEMTYGNTIWSRMQDRYNTTLGDVFQNYRVDTYIGRSTDVGLTNIANRPYLLVDYISNPNIPQNVFLPDFIPNMGFTTTSPSAPPPDIYPYVFSNDFYNGNFAAMSPYEIFVYNAITTRLLTDTTTLIQTYLSQYLSLSPIQQFYQIPVYLLLIDIAITSVSRNTP